MAGLKKHTSLLAVVAFMLFAMTVVAQSAKDSCKAAPVIPFNMTEPPAKIIIDPPLPEPLSSRGVAIIQYCAENLHIVPVFGPNTTDVSPRVGHIHISLDDASWVWADASGNPIILQGLSSGVHKVRIDLVDANHHPLDKGTITFTVPDKKITDNHH